MNGPVVGEGDKIVAVKRNRQVRAVGGAVGDQVCPQNLRLCRFGKGRKGGLQHHGLLTGDGEQGRHEGVAPSNRQCREVDLRDRRDVEETLRLRYGELGAARLAVNTR